MYCRYCGIQVSDDSVFCETCGKQLKDKLAKYNGRQKCIQCGINLPEGHINKRCNECRCNNMDRVKGIGGSVLLGAALLALAAIPDPEGNIVDVDDEYTSGEKKCTHCYSNMKYIDYEYKWKCTCCEHEVDKWDSWGQYI